MKYLKSLPYILCIIIPNLCAVLVGTYFGYPKYFEELKYGSDKSEALQWALVGGIFTGIGGFIAGLVIAFFIWVSVWMITTPPKIKAR